MHTWKEHIYRKITVDHVMVEDDYFEVKLVKRIKEPETKLH